MNIYPPISQLILFNRFNGDIEALCDHLFLNLKKGKLFMKFPNAIKRKRRLKSLKDH